MGVGREVQGRPRILKFDIFSSHFFKVVFLFASGGNLILPRFPLAKYFGPPLQNPLSALHGKNSDAHV